MRTVIQRVSKASVTVESNKIAQINKGLLLLLGIEERDENEDIEWLVRKIINMRIFSDKEGNMNLSLSDIDGELLIVSQFTLHASTKKGNRPGFIKAAKPEMAIPLYKEFIEECERYRPGKVKAGQFGADMKVELLNDGPVTIILDSKNKE